MHIGKKSFAVRSETDLSEIEHNQTPMKIATWKAGVNR